jgi:heptosyltransferase-2/heptosyltransferase-3
MLGAGPEYALNRDIAALGGVPRVYNVADDLPIPRLLALLARADGLISVDSGPAHAAAAVGCPLIVLFGKASPSLYRPWGASGAAVTVLTGEIDGEASMLGIDTASVTRAWAHLRRRDSRQRC